MKETIKGYLHYSTKKHTGDAGFEFWPHSMGNTVGLVFLHEMDVEIDVPDDFNPIPGQVEALEKKKRQLKAEFARQMMEIEDSISKLLCITNEVES